VKRHFTPWLFVFMMLAFVKVAASETVTGYIFGDGKTELFVEQQGCDYYTDKVMGDERRYPIQIIFLDEEVPSNPNANLTLPPKRVTFTGIIIVPGFTYYPEDLEGKCGLDIVGIVYPDGKVSIKSVNPDNTVIQLPNYWGEGKIVNVGRKNKPNYQLTGELLFEHGAAGHFTLTLQDLTSIDRCTPISVSSGE
jgi:hypothetical protein